MKNEVAYQVTKPKDSLSVSDNNCSDVILGPIPQNIVNVALIMDCNE